MKRTARVARNFHWFVLSLAASLVLIASPAISQEPAEAPELLRQAETAMRMGISDLGASRSFEHAGELLEQATQDLKKRSFSEQESENYQRQLEAINEDLDILAELYEEQYSRVGPSQPLEK